MPERQAIVTLYPIFIPDAFPFRSLNFTSDNDYYDVGRSSKREAKNLSPARDNALFDSRVMSRDHARIRVSMEKKTAFIRDGGSMHGTWVNGRKIPFDEDVPINGGDILTFGADVMRGTETFPPLRVRCGCEWFDYSNTESKPNNNTHKEGQSINCFRVPDDDDESDIVEFISESRPTKPTSEKDYESEDSDRSHDSENHESVENTTPITSPSNKGVPLGGESKFTKTPGMSNDANANRSDGTSHSPIVVDSPVVVDSEEPLVTPRMTPPILNASDEPKSINIEVENVDHSNRASSVPENPDEEFYNELDYLDYSEDDHNIRHEMTSEAGSSLDLHSSDDDTSDSDSQSEDEGSRCDDMDEERQSETDCGHQALKDDALSCPITAEKEVFSLNCAAVFQPRQPDLPRSNSDRHPPKPCLLESPWLKSDAAPSSFVQSNDKPFTRLPSLIDLHSNGWEPQGLRYSPDPVSLRNSFGTLRYNCTRGSPANRSSRHLEDSFGSPSKPNDDIYNAEDPWYDQEIPSLEKPSELDQPDMSSKSMQDDSQVERETNTRVSIADIVDSPEARAAQGQSQKRKAAEMESDTLPSYDAPANLFTADADPESESEDDETSSQDDKLHIAVKDLDSSQIARIFAIHDAKSASEDLRPAKRVKAFHDTRGRRWASHAVTAVAGAVIGGLGTVALLASLPPEYFA